MPRKETQLQVYINDLGRLTNLTKHMPCKENWYKAKQCVREIQSECKRVYEGDIWDVPEATIHQDIKEKVKELYITGLEHSMYKCLDLMDQHVQQEDIYRNLTSWAFWNETGVYGGIRYKVKEGDKVARSYSEYIQMHGMPIWIYIRDMQQNQESIFHFVFDTLEEHVRRLKNKLEFWRKGGTVGRGPRFAVMVDHIVNPRRGGV